MTTRPRTSMSLDGELLEPGSAAYDAARRPENPAYADVLPSVVVRCASEADVVQGLAFARDAGLPVVPRGGGHCFAGRSSTEGVLLDLSLMSSVEVVDDTARVGAGVRLGRVYAELHRAGRTLPGGCGETVGIAGLTLGGGIGLIGRRHGLTCDRLVAARVVLADGRVVDCDQDREPDLFWALRGAGGGQFGVVTSLTFETVPEPLTTRFELRWDAGSAADLVDAWQRWAPYAPEELTANLTLAAEPGRELEVIVFGASMLDEQETRRLLDELPAAPPTATHVRAGLPYSELKRSFAGLDPREDIETRIRIRSELFDGPLRPATIGSLVAALHDLPGEPRHLTFLALGGAYDEVAADATAYAHRGARFNLEHAGPAASPWVDRSWELAHAEGSGGVYANFPDLALADGPAAYHRGNLARLARIKRDYDPDGLFAFPQCISPGPEPEETP